MIRRILNPLTFNHLRVPLNLSSKYFHPEFTNPEVKKLDEDKHIPTAVRNKYKIFRDEDSPEIFDVEEEKERYQTQDDPEGQINDEFLGVNLKRGLHGVFDIDDLVQVLRMENAADIFVCRVPKQYKYVDYMVIVTGKSYRHMFAVADFVRRVFKKKRNVNDIIPRLEGEKSRDWMCLDLGNIALHVFSQSARETYDLESLWSIGAKYDFESNKPQDPLVDLFEKHSRLLNEVKPNEC